MGRLIFLVLAALSLWLFIEVILTKRAALRRQGCDPDRSFPTSLWTKEDS